MVLKIKDLNMGYTRGSLVPATEHQAIMAAGWSYRMNDRGWIIYRDPQSGLWHTRSDAVAIVENGLQQIRDATADRPN